MSPCDAVNWEALPRVLENVQGDPVPVMEGHVRLAKLLLPPLLEQLKNRETPLVVSLFGGSGCGKTGTAAALAWALSGLGMKTAVVGGDHYPRRIPACNDAERLSRFRAAGLAALVREGLCSEETQQSLRQLWREGTDADPALTAAFPFLKTYQKAGEQALEAYLGTPEEQDYEALNRMLADFRGQRETWVRCLGRTEDSLGYARLNAKDYGICLLEWTHGGSGWIDRVDIPIYLDSTPESTRLARRLRGRDAGTDSPFTAMVLKIEQDSIQKRVPFAALVLRGDEVTAP